MKDMLAAIGGKKGDKLGPNGELATFKDECFSFTAGKYIYEACPFKKAHQKDRDDSKGSGTNLRQWKGMEFDEESRQRIMRWEGGAKCWNGPNRSATVYVTSGAETKVISADEPETCRYVLQMESHIACDDAYKEKFGF
jgi:protein kinase C substrate 80K-H